LANHKAVGKPILPITQIVIDPEDKAILIHQDSFEEFI
jgi:hypothetical protein